MLDLAFYIQIFWLIFPRNYNLQLKTIYDSLFHFLKFIAASSFFNSKCTSKWNKFTKDHAVLPEHFDWNNRQS